jgi:hypothetical protein
MELIDRNRIYLVVQDYQGLLKGHIVALSDVVRYYAADAHNLSSGCRMLGSIIGDWRPIDCIAYKCLQVFKRVNPYGLQTKSAKYGLIFKSQEVTR